MKLGKKPNLANIHEFGAAAYVKDLKAGKLDLQALVGRFVGYDIESKGYRIYWPTKRTISVERNIVINQNDVHTTENLTIIHDDALAEGERNKDIQSIPKNPGNVEDTESISENESQQKPDAEEPNDEPKLSNTIPFPSTTAENVQVVPETNTETQPQAYGRGQRPRKAPGEYKALNEGLVAVAAIDDDLQTEYPSSIYSEHPEPTYNLPPNFAFVGTMDSEPESLDEALRGPKAKEWQTALEYEINQLEKLNTWVVEDLPKQHTAIPCSEVLKIKRGPDGEIKSYRVRIVAGGHRQIEGINYTETFLSAAKMPTVHTVLANAAEQNWEVEHVNIKSAYLNVPLKETVFMCPPRGVLKPGQQGKVLRLLKGLYGLKQAGQGWYQEMSRVLIKELGFNRSAIDHSVFIRRSEGEHTVIAVATDDMALTSKRAIDAENFKGDIKRYWDITDHGPIGWFLGFQIKRDRKNRTISINQHAYIESLAEKFQLINAKPIKMPIKPGTQYLFDQCPFTPNQVAKMKGIRYNEAIGSILWPAVVSRPDIAYVTSILSQFLQNPGYVHWEGVKRVISYLNTTKNYWLTFGGSTKNLVEGYSDADWASQKDRHSISGYTFFLSQGVISWSLKWQHIIALLSTESEYIAQTHAAKEALWLIGFTDEIRGEKNQPINLYCDNQGAIALAKDNKFHVRTKHIDLRFHFIREAVEDNKILITYIPTEENVADIFTKALVRPKFKGFVGRLGLAEEKGRSKDKRMT